MSSLRLMEKKDLDQVNLILSKSFTHAREQSGFSKGRIPLCFPSFLEMYLAANPGGSFVIEKKHRIIAYCFSRLWGSVGWIGPLSVLPAEQSKGLGKEIVTAAVKQLQAGKAATIGLELNANSCKNLAFYTKLGFLPGRPTVDLVKEISAPVGPKIADYELRCYSDADPEERISLLSKLRDLSSALEKGLDYTHEIDRVQNGGFGDALVIMRGSQAIGLALVHTETYTAEERRHFLKINALQLAPGEGPELLKASLSLFEKWAQLRNLGALYIRVPLRYIETYRQILSEGFQIVQNELRMTLIGYGQNDDPDTVNLSKWE